MIAYQLHESRTHKLRRYSISPVPGSGVVEALLSIRLGEVGPRGGVSKMRWETYQVCEPENDPEEPCRPGRTFLVVKLGGTPQSVSLIKKPFEECLYEVHIPPRGTVGYCTCTGYATNGLCKHLDTFDHLVNVVGMGKGFVVAEAERVACCGLPGCDICGGLGYVEVEPGSSWNWY